MADINLGVGGANSATGGYEIDNSLKLEADNSENLYRNLNASTSTTKFTHSMWVKRTELTNAQLLYMRGVAGNESVLLRFSGESGYEHGLQVDIGASSTNARSVTTRKFRDPSAWYHIVLAVDTTQSTAANRRRLYVNGVEETVFGMSNLPSQNFAMEVSSAKHRYGAYNDTDNYAPFSGYIAECHYIDGSQLDASSFGETDNDSGIWKPKEYTGSYGTGGYYLDFSDGSDLGANAKGDDVNFTLRNIAAADQATDTPTNNFCILNTNHRGNYFKAPTEGGTYIPMNGVNQDAAYAGTIGVTQGKWYYETYIDMRSSTYGLTVYVGYHTFQDKYQDNAYWASTDQESFAGYQMHGGNYYSWDSGSRVIDSSLGGLGTSQVGQFFGVALNLDDNQISFYVNGSAISNATNLALNDLGDETDTGIFALPAISVYDNNHTVNFGGYTKATISSPQSDANGYGTFEHAPPSGYYALCSKNLAEFG